MIQQFHFWEYTQRNPVRVWKWYLHPVLAVALFPTAKRDKHPKRPLTDK